MGSSRLDRDDADRSIPFDRCYCHRCSFFCAFNQQAAALTTAPSGCCIPNPMLFQNSRKYTLAYTTHMLLHTSAVYAATVMTPELAHNELVLKL